MQRCPRGSFDATLHFPQARFWIVSGSPTTHPESRAQRLGRQIYSYLAIRKMTVKPIKAVRPPDPPDPLRHNLY
jgi:hypothetical protein